MFPLAEDRWEKDYYIFIRTSQVPVEGKSSVCLMCMIYRIIILIIIIISLGEILFSYIANTSRTHALMHARTYRSTSTHADAQTHTNRRLHSGMMRRWRPSVTKLTPVPLAFMAGSWVIQINTCAGDPISPRFWMFIACTKIA